MARPTGTRIAASRSSAKPNARRRAARLRDRSSARQDLAPVAHPARDLFGVEVLEKRNRQTAGQPEHLLELADLEARPPRCPEPGDDAVDCFASDEPSARQADERPPLDEVPDEPVDDFLPVAHGRGHLHRRRRREPPLAEDLRDPLRELALPSDELRAPREPCLVADRNERTA